ncbi:MAG TPA: phosphoribosylanthranilate isomerase [Candidatus Acidoferrales bacterium]|nr:phosphoribosylanthranilate isomerase [Candidatus Acidoferrales bacterium]
MHKRGMVAVKICGITNWADARTAIDAGAGALGFNFYARSPRRVAVSHAREIVRHMPRKVSAVGVFVDASAADVLKIAREVKLGVLQLHGEESPKIVKELAREFPVIKAFRVGPQFKVEELVKYSDASAFLLDAFDSKLRGGTGKEFDWRIVTRVRRLGPVILAGGLTKENAAKAIRTARPFAIDVCSGVECAPGKKDAKKVREFMKAVQRKRGEEG